MSTPCRLEDLTEVLEKNKFETEKRTFPKSQTQTTTQKPATVMSQNETEDDYVFVDDDSFMLPKHQLTSTTLNPFFIGANSRRKGASRQYSPRGIAKQPETATVRDDRDYDYDLTNRHLQ